MYGHKPVLLEETIESLNIKPDGVYLDGTAGGFGHSARILEKLGERGRLICSDRDPAAIERGRDFAKDPRVTLINSNFVFIKRDIARLNIEALDGVLLDLGVSSFQLDEPERGFSYNREAPLDMRMDNTSGHTAADIVDMFPQEDLARIIRDYGEERFAARIAAFIAREREKEPITTTTRLAEIVKAAIPAKRRRQGGHPAKRTFQALRIEVNGELSRLGEALRGAAGALAGGGRLAVITFHSLEDRIVKTAFRELSAGCVCPPEIPVCVCGRLPEFRRVTGRPVLPGQAETDGNPRARSAKLRVLERIITVEQGG
ncbi:MAG: 16S rRNA (cytosine(1402)-N(4))-methyltransferase RsmH [Clostridiales bacterium]|jgi:16S rRNA (cytosine1402-N4)-methyltransferase|nr:16S rRNA (cytosine(1402)-N(4))-methyltransferase RsmH [Clostridiales bacterium]